MHKKTPFRVTNRIKHINSVYNKIEVTLDRMFLYTFSPVKGHFCSLLISNIFLFTSLSQIGYSPLFILHSTEHLFIFPILWVTFCFGIFSIKKVLSVGLLRFNLQPSHHLIFIFVFKVFQVNTYCKLILNSPESVYRYIGLTFPFHLIRFLPIHRYHPFFDYRITHKKLLCNMCFVQSYIKLLVHIADFGCFNQCFF